MRIIKNPRWSNDKKDQIVCEFHYPDGQVYRAAVSQTEQGNPDWEEIIRDFGVEFLDKETEKHIENQNKRKEIAEQRRQELAETTKTEALFNAKLDAFSIEEIKNSKNIALKSKIRKAKSIAEVLAYTSVLLMQELNNSPPVEEKKEEPAAPVVDEPVKAKRGRKKKT